ncbi:hypothetical protein DPMN_073544 [Dreissena polymorpha]|uniref:Uncharacterized protein n=1 Tax=Dreissena polymorpha TaxID=45954 RepID=A0A9D4HDD5_DREPO|nr:hypothetical protein DPMN_073544 [Dreissena polymorpha]
MYANTAIQLLLPELLPELELRLFDDNWTIRFRSIQLLGGLLYRISGTIPCIAVIVRLMYKILLLVSFSNEIFIFLNLSNKCKFA